MTLLIIIFFLATSLLFYVLFGGADFGAGVLELFLGKKRRQEQQRLISHAMAPVWEANHVWLVLAVVILFTGFPSLYTTFATYLHLPLIAMLIGIVGRGCAFTFRHYDVTTADTRRIYTKVFSYSSLWTSFFLGVVVGAVILGKINPDGESYFELYLQPWIQPFCVILGIFTVVLFALLAAVYLVGEARDEELQRIFLLRARYFAIILVLLGPCVFFGAELGGLPLAKNFLHNKVSMACFFAASICLFPFWRDLKKRHRVLRVRIFGVAIVSLVIFGWFAVQYPVALRYYHHGELIEVSFLEAAAPEETLRALQNALLVGVVLIFPALAYLFKIFKWETVEQDHGH